MCVCVCGGGGNKYNYISGLFCNRRNRPIAANLTIDCMRHECIEINFISLISFNINGSLQASKFSLCLAIVWVSPFQGIYIIITT